MTFEQLYREVEDNRRSLRARRIVLSSLMKKPKLILSSKKEAAHIDGQLEMLVIMCEKVKSLERSLKCAGQLSSPSSSS